MKTAAALSQHPIAALAVGEVVGEILDRLDGQPVDLLLVFIDSCHTGAVEDIALALRQLLGPKTMIGSTACGVISRTTEVEDSPGLSLWAASGADVSGLRIEPGEIEPFDGWPPAAASAGTRNVILLADPFSTRLDQLLDAAHENVPAMAIHGGLASAASGPGGNRLLLDGAVYTNGAVGVDLGRAVVQSVVSQGCRPVGEPLTVTGATGNVITELASQRPIDVLRQIAKDASPLDRQLLAGGVHIGLAFDNGQIEAFDQGDFLIRQVLGADPNSGAISIGAEIQLGDTVQFQARDASSATQDLTTLLASAAGVGTSAALCFTCNGRGMSLFGEPDHDALLVHELTGSNATAGMFCAGEIGPVGPKNHVHTFTASTLLFG